MEDIPGLLVHLFTFLLLLAAVGLVMLMLRRSGLVLPWLVLAAAFLLMSVAPLLDFYGHLAMQQHGSHIEDSDLLSLFASMLMLVGVFLLRRIVAERELAQQKLHQQLDELQRFHRLAVGRELRMKELAAENAVLRRRNGQTNNIEVIS